MVNEALKRLDLKTAEQAFIKLQDYGGIRFIKSLQNIKSMDLKKAEIMVFLGDLEKAEKIYFENDRRFEFNIFFYNLCILKGFGH